VLNTVLGEPIVAPELPGDLAVRARCAAELAYRAVWPDGRTEQPEPDRQGELVAALDAAEAAVRDEQARADQVGRRLSAQRRTRARPTAPRAQEHQPALHADEHRPAQRGEPARTAMVVRRGGLRAFLGWLVALLARVLGLLGRGGRAAPAGAPTRAPAPRRLAAGEDAERAALREREQLEAEQAAAEALVAALTSERDQQRDALDHYPAERRARVVARIAELTRAAAPPLEVEVCAPAVPLGLALLLRSARAMWQEPVDTVLAVGGDEPREPLLAELERARHRRPVDIARRAAAAVCSCRNQIRDVEHGARQAHQSRLNELTARRIKDTQAIRRRERSNARRHVARRAEEIVQKAATQLEQLLAEVRRAWNERVDSCLGVEQLRAEVSAIENGAGHRLTLVCHELREAMTVAYVRLVLEICRPLHERLARERLEVARGGPPVPHEAFEDLRLTLPASLDAIFAALTAADVGELQSRERGFLDPLFRTLAREKRECAARLVARLDEIEQTTARELYAAAVGVSPLLLDSCGRLVDDLLAAHDGWIDARLQDERRAYDALRLAQQPALDLIPACEAQEATLAALLERWAAQGS
jgi:hypothetical protein